MAKEITMPKLSDTMTEGLFAGWRKNVGERIERGDIIAEVETDKAVMELEAFASGVLLKTMAKDGELVPVGTVLGLIGEPGELTETADSAPESQSEAAAPAAPPAVPVPEDALAAPAQPATPQNTAVYSEQGHEKASPLVRRMARDLGIDLGLIHGSGPEGRVTREDLDGFAGQQTATAPMSSAAASEPAPPPETQPKPRPSSPMRQAIATAVTYSWQTIPHFSVSIEIDMDACREIVSELKASRQHIGYNALLIKACATILKQFPQLRSGPVEEGVHISFAVALEDGLMMPVIRGCDTLSAAEIELEAGRLAEKCRSGRLASEEMSGGCFSLSNLGMYGVDDFTALIMPGQIAILAAGAVVDRPVTRNAAVVSAATMRVTLSSDHRVVDGAYAARFLAELRTVLEKPVSLLV